MFDYDFLLLIFPFTSFLDFIRHGILLNVPSLCDAAKGNAYAVLYTVGSFP